MKVSYLMVNVLLIYMFRGPVGAHTIGRVREVRLARSDLLVFSTLFDNVVDDLFNKKYFVVVSFLFYFLFILLRSFALSSSSLFLRSLFLWMTLPPVLVPLSLFRLIGNELYVFSSIVPCSEFFSFTFFQDIFHLFVELWLRYQYDPRIRYVIDGTVLLFDDNHVVIGFGHLVRSFATDASVFEAH